MISVLILFWITRPREQLQESGEGIDDRLRGELRLQVSNALFRSRLQQKRATNDHTEERRFKYRAT